MAVEKCAGCGAPLTTDDGVCEFCGAKNTPGSFEGKGDYFDVILAQVGTKKINVIKVIRETVENDLRKAKELTDNAPETLKRSIRKADAEELKKKFEEVGAGIEIKDSNNGSIVYKTPENAVAKEEKPGKSGSGCLVLLIVAAVAFITYIINLGNSA